MPVMSIQLTSVELTRAHSCSPYTIHFVGILCCTIVHAHQTESHHVCQRTSDHQHAAVRQQKISIKLGVKKVNFITGEGRMLGIVHKQPGKTISDLNSSLLKCTTNSLCINDCVCKLTCAIPSPSHQQEKMVALTVCACIIFICTMLRRVQ